MTTSEDTNPDFHVEPDLHMLTRSLAPDQATRLGDVVRRLEDYLNRNVIRRARAIRVLGSGTTHATAGWNNVVPSVQRTFRKAAPDSVLLVAVSTHGLCDAVAGGREFGVNVDLDGTNVGDFSICSMNVPAAGLGDSLHIGGEDEVPVTGAGFVTLTLRYRPGAAGAAWTPRAGDSLAIAVAEVHPA